MTFSISPFPCSCGVVHEQIPEGCGIQEELVGNIAPGYFWRCQCGSHMHLPFEFAHSPEEMQRVRERIAFLLLDAMNRGAA